MVWLVRLLLQLFWVVFCFRSMVEYGCYLQHLFSKGIILHSFCGWFLDFFFTRDKTIAPNLNRSSVLPRLAVANFHWCFSLQYILFLFCFVLFCFESIMMYRINKVSFNQCDRTETNAYYNKNTFALVILSFFFCRLSDTFVSDFAL